VPGPVSSELSAAPHQLIRDGAGLIRGPDDLLQELGLEWAGAMGDTAVATGTPRRTPMVGLPPEAANVLRELHGATAPDVISARSGVPVHQVLAVLMGLELAGYVREVGGRYERTTSGSRGNP
jgi:DNA processing protein